MNSIKNFDLEDAMNDLAEKKKEIKELEMQGISMRSQCACCCASHGGGKAKYEEKANQ